MLIEMTENGSSKTFDILDEKQTNDALGEIKDDYLLAMQLGGMVIAIDDKVFYPKLNENKDEHTTETR